MQQTSEVSAPNHQAQVVAAERDQASGCVEPAYAADRWQVQSQDNLGNFEIRDVNASPSAPGGAPDPARFRSFSSRGTGAQPQSSSD